MSNHIKGLLGAMVFIIALSLGSCQSAPEPVIPKDIPTCKLCEFGVSNEKNQCNLRD